MSQQLVVGIPPAVLKLQQEGLLERSFHDGLFPALLFRGEAEVDTWPEHAGTEMLFTRPGLMAPVTEPIAPGTDPQSQTVPYEQWVAQLVRYANSIDTHIPTSVTANGDLFLRNIHQLGLNAGQSVNRIVRNALFVPYLSGSTNMIAAGGSTDDTIRVAALNGFTDVVLTANVRPVPVSSSSPLPITIKNSGGDIAVNVVGFEADDPTDPNGPGTLFLDAALGATVAIRTPVLSANRPIIIRAGGGFSVDAISSSDVLQLQDIINAVQKLRKQNVMPHEDGFFHDHVPTEGEAQLFTDQVVQRLNTSRPDDVYYQEAFIGTMAGCVHYSNNECPDSDNSGTLVSTGTSSFYSRGIGAETINAAGVRIGRLIITGRGVLQERWMDENKYLTEAGVTGKVGDFQIVNMGIQVDTDRVQLKLRAPLNKLMDEVSATWAATTSFAAPTDIASGGPQRYKRAICVEFAIE